MGGGGGGKLIHIEKQPIARYLPGGGGGDGHVPLSGTALDDYRYQTIFCHPKFHFTILKEPSFWGILIYLHILPLTIVDIIGRDTCQARILVEIIEEQIKDVSEKDIRLYVKK